MTEDESRITEDDLGNKNFGHTVDIRNQYIGSPITEDNMKIQNI